MSEYVRERENVGETARARQTDKEIDSEMELEIET